MNNINKVIISLTSMIVGGIASVFGLPAMPGLLQASQPDGAIIDIFISGDERNHIVYSNDGYILTNDNEGFYVFADVDANGNIMATNIREINPARRSAETIKSLSRLDQKRIKSVMEKSFGENEKGMMKGPGLRENQFPSYGEQKAIVILVEFLNKSFTIENPNEYYHRMLNEEGFSDYDATGSARDYFITNSLGKFKPEFDVYGPVKLDKYDNFYGMNDMWGKDVRPEKLVIDACKALDDEIDFSQYDRNEDGKIDNVYLFYAGYGEADGGGANTIWPHSWDLSQATFIEYYFDGVRLDHYACSNELKHGLNIPDGIGTFIHEFSHVMGLPDLYSTLYTGAFNPGSWNVLAHGPYNNNSRTPPNYSAFERYALDWMEPIVAEAGVKTLLPLGISNEAYLFLTEKENEYYLVENRQNEGFDTYLPSHGMLVWHVDYNEEAWETNVVNNDVNHQRVDLVEADNILTEDTREDDVFPGGANVTEFTCKSSPSFVSWAGKPLEYDICDIKETEAGEIIFNIVNCDASSVDVLKNANSFIHINGNNVFAAGEGVEIYDVAGKLITIINRESVTLPQGIYLAVKGKERVKFILP